MYFYGIRSESTSHAVNLCSGSKLSRVCEDDMANWGTPTHTPCHKKLSTKRHLMCSFTCVGLSMCGVPSHVDGITLSKFSIKWGTRDLTSTLQAFVVAVSWTIISVLLFPFKVPHINVIKVILNYMFEHFNFTRS